MFRDSDHPFRYVTDETAIAALNYGSLGRGGSYKLQLTRLWRKATVCTPTDKYVQVDDVRVVTSSRR